MWDTFVLNQSSKFELYILGPLCCSVALTIMVKNNLSGALTVFKLTPKKHTGIASEPHCVLAIIDLCSIFVAESAGRSPDHPKLMLGLMSSRDVRFWCFFVVAEFCKL